jgi:hypothetical protein
MTFNICPWCREHYGLPGVVATHDAVECRAIVKAKLDAAVLQLSEAEHKRDKYFAQMEDLTDALARANAAMLKHQKHNGALEIAVQEAHRDTDTANRLYRDQQMLLAAILVHFPEGSEPFVDNVRKKLRETEKRKEGS